jgi:hypothetical protein
MPRSFNYVVYPSSFIGEKDACTSSFQEFHFENFSKLSALALRISVVMEYNALQYICSFKEPDDCNFLVYLKSFYRKKAFRLIEEGVEV